MAKNVAKKRRNATHGLTVSQSDEKDFRRVLSGVFPYSLDFYKTFGYIPDISRDSLLRRFQGWSYICASRNAAAVASVSLKLYATRGTGEARARCASRVLSKDERHNLSMRAKVGANPRFKSASEIEEILEHPFLTLMQNVNPHENGFELMEKKSIYEDCLGDSYLVVERDSMGVPSALYLPAANWMYVQPDMNNYVSGYLYGRGPTRQFFKPEEVIHFKTPNPLDPFYGLGCIQAAIYAVDRYAAFDRYELALNENMGVPPIIVKYTKGSLSPEKRKEVEEQWNQHSRGVDRAGRVKVTDQDWSVEKIMLTPREMGFEIGRKWTRLEIADAFGVPLALLDTENVNRSNADVAMYQYQKFTIKPRLVRTEQKLNEKLIPMYDEPRLFCCFEENVPEDESADMQRNVNYVRNGIYTINEVRMMENLPPVAWGDEPVKPQANGAVEIDEKVDDEEENGQDKQSRRHSHRKADQPPLNPRERAMRDGLQSVFDKQRDQALRNVKIGNIHFDWVASESWAHEIVALTRGQISEEVGIGAVAGAKRIGMASELGPWIERPEVQRFVAEHSYKFALNVNETTRDRLREQVGLAMEAGETSAELEARVRDVFQGTDREARAEMIARTECARAQSHGTLLQWKESGVVTAVVWDAAGDSCEFCEALNGKQVAIGEAWAQLGDTIEGASGGSYKVTYEGIEAPPAHPNCRCGIQPVLSEEYEKQRSKK